MKEKFILLVDSINKSINSMYKEQYDHFLFYNITFISNLINIIDRSLFIKKKKFENYNKDKFKYLSDIFISQNDPLRYNINIYDSIITKFKRSKHNIFLVILETIYNSIKNKSYMPKNNTLNNDLVIKSLILFDLNPKNKLLTDLSIIKDNYKIKKNNFTDNIEYDNAFYILRDQYTDFKNKKIIDKYKLNNRFINV